MNSIDILPNELLLKIFQIILYCTGWDSVFKLRAVSKRWKALAERTLALANELTLCGFRPSNEDEFLYPIDRFLIDFSALSPDIVSLNLNLVMIKFWTLERIKIQCPKLKRLILKDCRVLTDCHFAPERMTDLEYLNISGTPVRHLELCHILCSFPNLYSLVLNNMYSLHCFTQMQPMPVYEFTNSIRHMCLDMSSSNRDGRVAFWNICKHVNLFHFSLKLAFLNAHYIDPLRKFKNLKCLKLSFYSDKTSYLNFPVLLTLEELHLEELAHCSKCVLNEALVLDLLRKLPCLKRLALELDFTTETKFKYYLRKDAFDTLKLSYVHLQDLILINLKNLHLEHFVVFGRACNLSTVTLEGVDNLTYDMIDRFIVNNDKVLKSTNGISMSPNCVYQLKTSLRLKTKIKNCKLFYVSLT